MRSQRLITGILALAFVSISLNTPALAAKPTTETYKDSFSETDEDFVCGQEVLIDIEGEVVVHVTDQGNGKYVNHFTTNATATFELNGVLYTASFTQVDQEVSTGKGSVVTEALTARAVGDDGSRILVHFTGHVTLNANGELTADVDLGFENCPD
jgi:hypothetical protein